MHTSPPTTLTSKGNTSTDVLNSLSSGCSMLPLRKKNLRPDRPVSCCRGGALPRHDAQQRKGQAWARTAVGGERGTGRKARFSKWRKQASVRHFFPSLHKIKRR